MRNAFIRALIEQNHNGSESYLLVGDLGYSVIEEFVDLFPDYYYNIGVAEQNMAGVAAGIAKEGNRVFCYSIGNFNTFRCAEQLRNDIDYHDLPVCTVSVGGGVAYGNMGYSHHAIQDYALMRSLPNTLILSPIDAAETELCMKYLQSYFGPAYLRLHKSGEQLVSSDLSPIVPGKPRLVSGSVSAKIALLSTGYAGQTANSIAAEDSRYAHYSMPAWGMKYKHNLIELVSAHKSVIVMEDHLVDAGFGSWVLEALVGMPEILKVRIKGLDQSVIGIVGSEDYIHGLAALRRI